MAVVTTCITPRQRDLHVATEAIALVAVAPFMLWLSRRRELEPWARRTALGIAVGTLVVDGYLLSRYVRAHASLQTPQPRQEPSPQRAPT